MSKLYLVPTVKRDTWPGTDLLVITLDIYMWQWDEYQKENSMWTPDHAAWDGTKHIEPTSPEYNGLAIRAQISLTATEGSESEWYGYRAEYRDIYSADLARAEGMVKTLRKLDRGLERLRTRYGYPQDFVTYVSRVADVLKLDGYALRHPDNGVFPSGERYRFTDTDGFRYWLADQVKDDHPAAV